MAADCGGTVKVKAETCGSRSRSPPNRSAGITGKLILDSSATGPPRTAPGDRVLISPQCGTEQPISGVDVSKRETVLGQDRVANFKKGLKGAAPGSYLLCLCPHDGSCHPKDADPQQKFYKRLIGKVVLEGPDVGHDVICNRGQPCTIQGIHGLNLTRGDRLTVLERCGSQDALIDLPGTGIAQLEELGSGEFVFASSDSLMVTPGMYYLCFCRRPNGGDELICTEYSIASFLGSVGIFTSRGPFTDQQFDCVIGVPCSLNNVHGVGLQEGDKLMILEECGSAAKLINMGTNTTCTLRRSSTEHNWQFGVLSLNGTEPSDVKLCWCPNTSRVSCSVPQHFGAPAGVLKIRCPNGYFTANGRCQQCTRGFYCGENRGARQHAKAIKRTCGKVRTTHGAGAISFEECVCARGAFLDGDLCQPCPQGYYKDYFEGVCLTTVILAPGARGR